mgnify:CR=1 FL=1
MRYGAGKPITIELDESNGTATITIVDRGIGISKKDHERIFKRFERAQSIDYGGLGLGLFITKQIVNAHGGEISVQSAEGKGAKFIVRLPMRAPTNLKNP